MNKTTPIDLLPAELVRISSDTSSYGELTSYGSFMQTSLSRQTSVLNYGGTDSSSNPSMFSPFGTWHTVLSRQTSTAIATLARQISDTSYGEIDPHDPISNFYNGLESSSDLESLGTINATGAYNGEFDPRNLYNTGVILTIQIPGAQYTTRAEDFISPDGDFWSVGGSY